MYQTALIGFGRLARLTTGAKREEMNSLPLCEQMLPCVSGGCESCNGTRHRLAQTLAQSASPDGMQEGVPHQQELI